MTYPSANEICDGVVNDCSGGIYPIMRPTMMEMDMWNAHSILLVGMVHHRLEVVRTVWILMNDFSRRRQVQNHLQIVCVMPT